MEVMIHPEKNITFNQIKTNLEISPQMNFDDKLVFLGIFNFFLAMH